MDVYRRFLTFVLALEKKILKKFNAIKRVKNNIKQRLTAFNHKIMFNGVLKQFS